LKREKVSSRETMSLLKMSRNLQMLFAVVMHLDGRLRFETLLPLKTDEFLICLVGTWKPTASITEHQLILSLKLLMRNKVKGSVFQHIMPCSPLKVN
jgi:hypothetical protein